MILAPNSSAETKPWATEKSELARQLLAKRANAAVSNENAGQTTGYMQELYRRDLLAPKEERLLFEWLTELKQHASILREIPDDLRCEQTCRDLFDIDEEIILVRNHLVESNLRLAVAAARKFRGPADVDFHDLICEGNAILLKAVDLFKVEFGYRFSTYAMTALHRGFYNWIQREYKRKNRYVSGEAEYFNGVEDEATPPEQALEAIYDVPRLLEALDDRERQIIVSRFGLIAGEKMQTFRELGNQYNLSKERIRQIANGAIAKMKDKVQRV